MSIKEQIEEDSALDWAYAVLRDKLPVGGSFNTQMVWSNRHGDSHRIIVLAGYADGSVVNLSHDVALVLGLKLDTRRRAVIVHGGGMDMAAWLCIQLGRHLHGDGYSLNHRRV